MMSTMQDNFGDIGPDDMKSDIDGLKKHENHSEMF